MRLNLFRAAAVLAASFGFAPAPPTQSIARTRVEQAAAALGGEPALRTVAAVSMSGISVRHHREQSERPEGPWFPTFTEFTDVRTLGDAIVRRTSRTRGFVTENDSAWSEDTAIVAARDLAFRVAAGAPADAPMPWDLVILPADLGPEHVLVAALDAADLHAEPDVLLHGAAHHVVSFTHRDSRVRLILTAESWPKAIEITRAHPYDVFWAPWGDVTQRVTFAAWLREPDGISFPRIWEYSTGADVDGTVDITRVRFDRTPPSPDPVLTDTAIREASAHRTRVADMPVGNPRRPAAELAPGIVKVPGSWDIVEVRQDDGVVIVEAPLTSGYSRRVIEDASARFPGVPIKALITTSDSWPHIGGLREYVARGIPIYALDLNVPILERLIAATYRTEPDVLARAPRRPIWHVVSARTTVGAGANRIELLPLRTISGERQMMVSFPQQRLLYTSDLFTIRGEMVFLPAMVGEAVAAAARDHLDPARAFGMHYDALPWPTVVASAQPKPYR